MTKYEVRVRRWRADGEWEYETPSIEASGGEEAKQKAVSEAPDEWEATDADPLCDFCEPSIGATPTAYTEVTVVDHGDIMKEGSGWDAPERSAWVCSEHHDVVQSLPTYSETDY